MSKSAQNTILCSKHILGALWSTEPCGQSFWAMIKVDIDSESSWKKLQELPYSNLLSEHSFRLYSTGSTSCQKLCSWEHRFCSQKSVLAPSWIEKILWVWSTIALKQSWRLLPKDSECISTFRIASILWIWQPFSCGCNRRLGIEEVYKRGFLNWCSQKLLIR